MERLRQPSPRDIFAAAIAGLGVAAGQLSAGWPDSLLRWSLLIGGSILAGVVARTTVADYIWNNANEILEKIRPVLRKLLLVLLVLVLALLSGRTIAMVLPPWLKVAEIKLFGCDHPVQLRLLSTSEGLQSAREIALAYERHTAQRGQGCPEVDIYVYQADPVRAHQALESGWTSDWLSILGPRPDLWLPGSTIFELSAVTSQGRISKVDMVSVAQTPIIVAYPEEMISPDVRVRYEGITWADVLKQAQAQKWDLARPDPTTSLTGKLATVAIYASLARVQGRPLTAAEARLVERDLEQALDRGGYPLGDELGLLCRHLRDEPPRGGVIVTEQQMERFNRELQLGGTCAALVSPAHTNRMKGIYPSDTLGFDHPVVRLEWKDSSNGQLEQARAFSAWLSTPSGRTALLDVGLRPRGESDGLPPVRFDPQPPDRTIVADTINTYQLAKRPGRVLLALDTSGSMLARTPGGQRRFDLAVDGVSQALDMIGARDEVGLWVFPGSGKRELVPLGPGSEQSELIKAALPAITPGRATPLYRTIVDAVNKVGATNGESAKAVVVLTDGEDSGSGLTSAQVVNAVSGKGVRVFIVAVGEASCASQALIDITGKSGGSCRQATFGSVQAALSEVFTLLWKGA